MEAFQAGTEALLSVVYLVAVPKTICAEYRNEYETNSVQSALSMCV